MIPAWPTRSSYIAGKQDENGRWALEYNYARKTWVTVWQERASRTSG